MSRWKWKNHALGAFIFMCAEQDIVFEVSF